MQRKILYNDELVQVKDGLDKAANLVKVTLGAKGRTVILKTSYFHPNLGTQQRSTSVTKDGISVLRQINIFEDIVQNVGVELLKQASEKTMSEAGDATTTTCVLMQAIVHYAFDAIKNGAKALDIKKGIDIAIAEIVDQLKAMSAKVDDGEDTLLHIATVSANNDQEIGSLIADAFKKMGKDGIIDIGKSHTGKTEMQISEGLKFEKGYASPYFVTNVAKGECVLEHPYILLYDKRLTIFKQIQPLFEKLGNSPRPLLVICDGADGEALATFVYNAVNKTHPCCIVSCPDQGQYKRESMEDLALITGATFINEEKGTSLKNARVADLGEAEKVIIGKDFTNIISPIRSGGDVKIKELVDELRMDLVKAKPEEKEHIEKRIATLTGGVAILNVGAPTDVELGEKRDRCDDAVRAVKAAIAEGFVPGGGTAFLRVHHSGGHADGILTGKMVVYNAVREPFKQICRNAGMDDDGIDSLITEVLNHTDASVGYNVVSEKIEDLVKSGIIDPTKALRVAIQNAGSAAGVLITSGGLLADQL